MALTCCLYTFPISDLDPKTMQRLGFTATETLLWDYSNSEEFYVYVIPPAVAKPTLFLVPNTYAYQWYGLNGSNGLQIVYYPFLNMNFTNLQNPCRCPPIIFLVSPNTGVEGDPVVITGLRFTNATLVTFGGTPAVFTFISDTSISAIVPAGAGTVDIQVTTTGGVSDVTINDQFTYVTVSNLPVVTLVDPNNGFETDTVTISGMFFTGVTEVDFGIASAMFTFIDDSTISATVPAFGGSFLVDVTVTTPLGTSAITPNDQFTYDLTNPPVIFFVDTGDGIAGDTTQVINGEFFTGVTLVQFQGVGTGGTTVSVPFTFVDDGTINIDVVPPWPGGISPDVNVIVTVPGGDSGTSGDGDFSYDNIFIYRWPEDVAGWRMAVNSTRMWSVSNEDTNSSSFAVGYNSRTAPTRVITSPDCIDLSQVDFNFTNWGNTGPPGQILQDANYVYYISYTNSLVSRIPVAGTFDDIEHLPIAQGMYPLGTVNRTFGGASAGGNWNCCIHGTKMYVPWAGEWNSAGNQMLLLIIDLAAWDPVTGWAIHAYSNDITNFPGAWGVCVTDNGVITMSCQIQGVYPATNTGRIYYSTVANPSVWAFLTPTYAPAFGTSSVNKAYFLENTIGGSASGIATRATHLIIADCSSGTPVLSYSTMTDDPNFLGIAQTGEKNTVFPLVSGSHLFIRANATVVLFQNHVGNLERQYLAKRNLSDGSAAGGQFIDQLLPWTWEFWNDSLEAFGGTLYNVDYALAYANRYWTVDEALTTATIWPNPNVAPPSNDLFANAITMTLGTNYLNNSYYATFETNEQTPIQWNKPGAPSWENEFRPEHTVWYKFVAPADGCYPIVVGGAANVTINLPSNDFVDCMNTSVWLGSSLGSLTCILEHQPTFSSPYNNPWFVNLTLYAASGVTYWIRTSQWIDRIVSGFGITNFTSLPKIYAEEGSNLAIEVAAALPVRQAMVYTSALGGVTHCMVPWTNIVAQSLSPFMTSCVSGSIVMEI